MANGEEPFTFVLDDPLANCFIYNPYAPNDDPKILIETYERTPEQNDDLGILHMRTEDYSQEHLAQQEAEAQAKADAEE